MKILQTETIFHALAIGVILHSLIYKGEVTTGALTAAAAIATLGRVTPTEKVDKRLDIPLGGKHEENQSGGDRSSL